MPLQHLFACYADDNELEGLTLECNSAEEIEEATDEFIRGCSKTQPYGARLADIIPDLPDYIWAAHPSVRISPAWLRKYGVSTEPDACESRPRVLEAGLN